MKKLVLTLLFGYTAAFAQDKVKFTAKIENRNSDTIFIANQKGKKIIALKNGVFSDSFDMEKGFYQLSDGTENTSLFLAPGYDLNLKMDAKMFDETIKYTGKGSKENNFLAEMALNNEGLEGLMDKGDQAAFQKAVTESSAKLLEKLKDPELDPLFVTAVGNGIKQQGQQMMAMLAQKQAAQKMEGNVSPEFDYENHKGGKMKLSDLKGKYVYIDTWATWCGPCRAEIPFLKKIEERYHGKNIEFVSISIDAKKDYEKWRKFVDEKQLGGVQLIADNDWNSKFVKDFGINSIPRFILIGPDGKVVSADAERPSSPALQQKLDQLLK